jgi:ketol-acid reductoisomerase
MKSYRDSDADPEVLRAKTLGIIGYGNQGRAQALNLRDSGFKVIVAAQRDASAMKAEEDGFTVLSVAEVADRADLLALLIPDEVQRQVYDEILSKRLRPGQTLDFAHGYNIHFRSIVPPPDVDVIMVAPRMIGTMVREAFEHGGGTPAYIGVHQNASGLAFQTALAMAYGIGATRAGVLETTFAQETELDLFLEQGCWPILIRTLVTTYEYLVSEGFPPEMVELELYGSEEAAEIFREMARVGLFRQMRFHSQTSQYGTLSRSRQIPFAAEMPAFMRTAMAGLRNGHFVEEWRREQEAGYPVFNQLRVEAETHPLNEAEERMRQILKTKPQ